MNGDDDSSPADIEAEIRQLIADAPGLKAAAGISGRGRKSKKPMGHLILSWEPGAEISEQHAFETGWGAVRALGLDKHHAVLAFHEDKKHPHLHIAICRIDPDTGRTRNRKNPAQALSAYARRYEQEHGIVVPRREAIAQAYERRTAAEPGSAEWQQATALEEQLRRGRQLRRGPGRPRRPRWERKMWADGRRAGVPDSQTKTKIEQRRGERDAALRDTQDQRAVERALARHWPQLPPSTLSSLARRLKGKSKQPQPDVARIGSRACARQSRLRPRSGSGDSVLGDGTVAAVRRTVERTLVARGRTVTVASAGAAAQKNQTRTPPDRSVSR